MARPAFLCCSANSVHGPSSCCCAGAAGGCAAVRVPAPWQAHAAVLALAVAAAGAHRACTLPAAGQAVCCARSKPTTPAEVCFGSIVGHFPCAVHLQPAACPAGLLFSNEACCATDCSTNACSCGSAPFISKLGSLHIKPERACTVHSAGPVPAPEPQAVVANCVSRSAIEIVLEPDVLVATARLRDAGEQFGVQLAAAASARRLALLMCLHPRCLVAL